MRTLVLGGALMWLAGCYSHQPVPFFAAPAGEMVRVRFTEEGRARIGQTFGLPVTEVLGRILRNESESILLSLRLPTSPGSAEYFWLSREFRVSTGDVQEVALRRLDRKRTTVLVLAGGLAFVLGIHLINVVDAGGESVADDGGVDFGLVPPPLR